MFTTHKTPASFARCRPEEVAVFAVVFQKPFVSPMPEALEVRAPGEIYARLGDTPVRLTTVGRIEEIISQQANANGATACESSAMTRAFFEKLQGAQG